jgi:alkylated DNA repair dioxygenase AlkB
MFVGTLPTFASEVAQRLIDLNLLIEMPDQMIVNEYLPGQGISAHVDCEPCFTSTIATVSLGSQCEMEFVNVKSGQKSHILLSPGSALVMTGEARYDWTHAIPFRKTDHGIPRQRRVSLTFRRVIVADAPESSGGTE